MFFSSRVGQWGKTTTLDLFSFCEVICFLVNVSKVAQCVSFCCKLELLWTYVKFHSNYMKTVGIYINVNIYMFNLTVNLPLKSLRFIKTWSSDQPTVHLLLDTMMMMIVRLRDMPRFSWKIKKWIVSVGNDHSPRVDKPRPTPLTLSLSEVQIDVLLDFCLSSPHTNWAEGEQSAFKWPPRHKQRYLSLVILWLEGVLLFFTTFLPILYY